VSASASAVAVSGHGLLVEVVHERAAGRWEAGEGDAELDTGTVGCRDGGNRATDGAAFLDGQSGDVAGAGRAVRDLGGGSDSRGLCADDGRRGEEGEN
jgi:hypothetical protein